MESKHKLSLGDILHHETSQGYYNKLEVIEVMDNYVLLNWFERDNNPCYDIVTLSIDSIFNTFKMKVVSEICVEDIKDD